MSIIKNGVETYAGAVVEIWDHMWMDGMLDEFAKVWDAETHEFKNIQIGYFGSDGRNLMESEKVTIDISTDIARDIIRTHKRSARVSYCKSVTAHKEAIEVGIKTIVVRGRKVPKGTVLDVFWCGERPTYTGYGTELIAGCFDKDGNKVWIKAAYLKNISPIKSPSAKERKKFIKNYINKTLPKIVIDKAKEA